MEITQEQLDVAIKTASERGEAKAAKDFSEIMKKKIEDAVIEQAKKLHPFAGGTYIPNPEKGQPQNEPLLGKIGVALIRSKGVPELAESYAKKKLEADKTVTNERLVKSLQAGNFASAGLLIGDDVLPEIQDHLRASAVIRRMNPRILPMTKGGLKINRGTGDVTATWTGENTPVIPTDPTFDQLVMTAKTLKTKAVLSNDLIEADDFGVEKYVSESIAASMGLGEDLAAIRGAGSENTPAGIREQLASGNDFATTGTTLANIMTDLGTAMAKFSVNNVIADPSRVGIIMNPGVMTKLWIMTDSTGVVYPFRDEIARGKLFGWNLDTTTQIPLNLGAGADETEIYVVDFSKFVIGETKSLAISFDNMTSYENPAGTTYSLQDRGETCIRAEQQVDFGLIKDLAAVKISGVKYFLS